MTTPRKSAIKPKVTPITPSKPAGVAPAKPAKAALRVPEPGRYSIRGQSEAIRRQGDARRAVEDRQVLRDLGLLD